MKNLILALSLLISPALFAKGTLIKSGHIKIKYGYKRFDELSFEKKKGHWLTQFTDREFTRGTYVFKRAFPHELVEEQLFQLEYLLKRFGQKIKSREGLLCASRLVVEASKKKKQLLYCLDQLSDNESRQMAGWINKTTDLFRF